MVSGVYEAFDGASCFRPYAPTPPPIVSVLDLMDQAADSVRLFDRRLQEWPEPGVVGRLFARLDAVSSAGAEGSTTTFTDLLEYESSLRSAPDAADAASVVALLDATMEPVEEDLRQTILRLHRRLFERGTPLQAASAGLFKDRVNRTLDADLPDRFFAYTAPPSVPAAMTEWQAYVLDADARVPELVRQCLGHWFFEHIHPFQDGNGRVGRLLVPKVLHRKGFTRSVSAFVSEGIYHDKQLYIDALKDARITNDMLGWTRLMLGFLVQGAKSNLARLDRLLALKGEWEAAVKGVRSDSAIHRLVSFALTRPAFTVTDAVGGLGGTFASVNNAVAKLAEMSILAVAKGVRRDRLFQAPAVLDVFDHFRVRRQAREDSGRSARGRGDRGS